MIHYGPTWELASWNGGPRQAGDSLALCSPTVGEAAMSTDWRMVSCPYCYRIAAEIVSQLAPDTSAPLARPS